MIKVKCIGSLMSQGYFAGEVYEISKDFYEANKNCFEEVNETEPKVMTTDNLITKEKKTK